MKSIIQTEKECFFCKTPLNLETHHIFFGRNRKTADKDGCVCWLCVNHHTGAQGVHTNREKDLELKRICQRAWMEKNNKTIEDFISRYGKNYL